MGQRTMVTEMIVEAQTTEAENNRPDPPRDKTKTQSRRNEISKRTTHGLQNEGNTATSRGLP